MYKLHEINKKLGNGEDENIPNWMIKNTIKWEHCIKRTI